MLCFTRRCVENAFGIMVSRWRIFERTIGEHPANAEELVKAVCVLHNFLMTPGTQEEHFYCPPGYGDYIDLQGELCQGQWREEGLQRTGMPLQRTLCRNFSRAAAEVRDRYKAYFSSDAGAIGLQYKAPGL